MPPISQVLWSSYMFRHHPLSTIDRRPLKQLCLTSVYKNVCKSGKVKGVKVLSMKTLYFTK